ncbi:GroES-like protein [Dentipellis sp. KUC8613]|nr:GroES-like protein [Dentipellis sp. KUC8613]
MPATQVPKTQKAAIVQKDLTISVESVPVASPGAGEVLVKINAAAQNPTDWKSIEWGTIKPGSGTGCDFAGVVVEIGEGVTNVSVGDRVAGFVVASLGITSSFREYTVAAAHPLYKIPDNVTDKEAATLPLALATAAIGMRRLTDYPQGAPYNRYVLVWGGASSVGLYAIQLAHLSSYKVIATASPKNHELVKQHGADVVIDYHAPDVVEQIINATGKQDGVDYVYDAISEGNSMELSVKALRPNGPRKIGVVLPQKEDGLDPSVEFIAIACASILGIELFCLGHYHLRDERDYQFGIEFAEQISGWLRDGRFKGNRYTVCPGGLAGVQDGLAFMKSGKVSGTKLVYRIADTP